MISSAEFRKRYFPQLAETSWLASCSLAPLSTELQARYHQLLNNMLEAHHLPWHAFETEVANARTHFACLINTQPEHIALLPNASICAYQLISTLPPRDSSLSLLYSDAEFPSVANVWQAQATYGANVEYGNDDLLRQRLQQGPAPDLLSLPAACYQSGRRLPINEMITLAHTAGSKVAIDAYPLLGVMPIDVNHLGCDFLFGGTMKYLLGLPGLAFLYVRDPEQLATPRLTGWFARQNPFDFCPHQLDFTQEARRLETGTQAIPAVIAANAGFKVLKQLDLHAVSTYVQHLLAYAATCLIQQGETLVDYDANRPHGAHLAISDPHPERLASFLEQYAIITSPRGHVLRLSFHYFCCQHDIDHFCQYLKLYRRQQRGACES
jgi:selenocysteine lyase/cysteine desulfurase